MKIADDFFLHTLCKCMDSMPTTFNEFYDVCYCDEKNKEGAIVKINHGNVERQPKFGKNASALNFVKKKSLLKWIRARL